MPHTLIGRVFPAILGALTLVVSLHAAGPDKKSKPTIVVKVTPLVGFSPARMILTADLKGGADDSEEFYCPTIEWDWGDDTKSEMKTDCEPYEAGKSEIKRRFTVEHVFRAGSHQIAFRLKRRDKAIALATTTIQVQGGGADFGR